MNNDKKRLVINVLDALARTYIVSLLIIVVLAMLLYFLNLQEKFISTGIVFAYAGACFVGGRRIGKKMEIKRFLWGLLIGVCYFLTIFFMSLIGTNNGNIDIANSMILLGLSCCGGILGGMFSWNK